MVLPIFWIILISVERVGNQNLVRRDFGCTVLAISPAKFFNFWERAFPLEFSEKKTLAGTLGLDPLFLVEHKDIGWWLPKLVQMVWTAISGPSLDQIWTPSEPVS
jgi:hypothetical protein